MIVVFCFISDIHICLPDQIKVHGNDFGSLHKSVDKDILPKDYGGEGMSLDELTGNYARFRKFNEKRPK